MTSRDPTYDFEITQDSTTGEYVVTFPILNVSYRGPTFDDVSEWALDYLAAEYGLDP